MRVRPGLGQEVVQTDPRPVTFDYQHFRLRAHQGASRIRATRPRSSLDAMAASEPRSKPQRFVPKCGTFPLAIGNPAGRAEGPRAQTTAKPLLNFFWFTWHRVRTYPTMQMRDTSEASSQREPKARSAAAQRTWICRELCGEDTTLTDWIGEIHPSGVGRRSGRQLVASWQSSPAKRPRR